jgi:hypothetical protein
VRRPLAAGLFVCAAAFIGIPMSGAGAASQVAPDASDAVPRANAAAAATVLATGDSMMQILDIYLARRLEPSGKVDVRSDTRISTGISKPSLLNWPRYAASQARRLHPRATVMFLGANDGFNFRSRRGRVVRCCSRTWSREYARRARRMMVSYTQGGSAKVYWLLLPQARAGFFRRAYPAVNRGLRRAARRLKSVRLIALNKVFTPRGRYRQFIRYGGRRVNARQRDGVHLSPAGADIAAAIVARRMRADKLP